MSWFLRTVSTMLLGFVWWLPLAWWETIIVSFILICAFVTIGIDYEEEE